MQLTEVFADEARHERVLAACEGALEAEIAGKRGVSGFAVRAGYGAFKRVEPGIVQGAFRKLLPHFAPVIQPHWDRAREQGDVVAYFDQQREEVAEGLLSVTDALAERAENRVLIKIYRSLRGVAQPHVAAGVCRIPEVLSVVSPTDQVV